MHLKNTQIATENRGFCKDGFPKPEHYVAFSPSPSLFRFNLLTDLFVHPIYVSSSLDFSPFHCLTFLKGVDCVTFKSMSSEVRVPELKPYHYHLTDILLGKSHLKSPYLGVVIRKGEKEYQLKELSLKEVHHLSIH